MIFKSNVKAVPCNGAEFVVIYFKKQCIMKQLLDPVFVILYINDVHFCSEKFNFFLFADDTNILKFTLTSEYIKDETTTT